MSMAGALKSAFRKVPGSGAVQRLFEKTVAKTEPEIDVKNIAKITEGDNQVYHYGDNASDKLTSEELDEICNVSRLHSRHRCLVNNQLPPQPTDGDYFLALHYQRKRYARYGAATNIDPRKLWPNDKELETIKVLSNLRYLVTVEDLHRKVAENKAEEAEKEAASRRRDEEIVSKIPKIEELKAKIYNDAVKLEEQLNEAEEKRNKRIEQVKRFFQYTLDVKDPRFKEKMVEMIQQEKEAQKMVSKAAKKKKSEELKAQKEAQKIAAIKARREAKAKADAESSDDE